MTVRSKFSQYECRGRVCHFGLVDVAPRGVGDLPLRNADFNAGLPLPLALPLPLFLPLRFLPVPFLSPLTLKRTDLVELLEVFEACEEPRLDNSHVRTLEDRER